MFNMDAVPEDMDSNGDHNIDVVIAKTLDPMPVEIQAIWYSLTPNQYQLVRIMMMGALTFGVNIVNVHLKEALESAIGGDAEE